MISELFIKYWRKFIQKLDNNSSFNLDNNNKLKVKQYLKVPYVEKDKAKQLGARWDNNAKAWFIPEGIESLPFEKWIPKREQAMYIEPNTRTKGFYIVESKELCWKCHKITKVFAFLLPKGNEHIEEIYDEDKGESYNEWFKFEHEFFITYVEYLNKEALTIMEKFSSNYYYDFSKFIKEKYYINHCEHCGSNQGDHFMFEEHGGAFLPSSIAETKQMKFYWFEEFLEASTGGYLLTDVLEYIQNKTCQSYVYESKIVDQILEVKKFFYDGGKVSKELLEEAIDFMISIEPNTESLTCDQEFKESRNKYKAEINMVYAAIRQYGRQISNKTLVNMQDIFYSIINSDKYLQSPKHGSVAYTLLNHCWNGIGAWRK